MGDKIDRHTQQLSGQLQQVSTDLSSRLDTLTAKTNSLEGRLSAVETKQAQLDPAVEVLRAELEVVMTSMIQAQDEVLLRVERLDQRGNETWLMLFGLPEEQAAGGAQLSQAVMAELHGAAVSHGFTASCIISAERLGSVSGDTARPRAVRVRCQSVADKHPAFKGRSHLKAKGLRFG